MPRFFSKEQRQAHSAEIGGYHSELVDENGIPYTGPIEAHHMTPVWQGGETTDENLMFTDKVSHAIIHLISDDPYSFQLIKSRMTQEELDELHRRGY